MTTPVDRRQFLTRAALGGATIVGATALGSLAPEAAFGATGPAVAPGTPDPAFAEGRITKIDGSMILATGSDGTLNRIQATSATSVWKLTPTTLGAAQVGDGLYARGVRMPDGSLAADALWVNIVSLDAHVVTLASDRVHLDHQGNKITGHVVKGVSAAVYNGTPAVTDLSMVPVGGHVHVVGAWRPDTAEIDVSTVYAKV
ncbi:cell wall protein [Catenulispora subtropica]|uniref:Cell wall protein n=1 Tax=Catenulispora subtropica TaxID=450798 RepID=A0ABN2S5S7_9ACTN